MFFVRFWAFLIISKHMNISKAGYITLHHTDLYKNYIQGKFIYPTFHLCQNI